MRQILLVLLGNDCPKPTAKNPIPIDYYLIAEELVKAGSKIFVIMKMSPIKVSNGLHFLEYCFTKLHPNFY